MTKGDIERYLTEHDDEITQFEKSPEVQRIINAVYHQIRELTLEQMPDTSKEEALRLAIARRVYRRYFKNWVK